MHSRFGKYRKSVEVTDQSNSVEFEVNFKNNNLTKTNINYL